MKPAYRNGLRLAINNQRKYHESTQLSDSNVPDEYESAELTMGSTKSSGIESVVETLDNLGIKYRGRKENDI